MANQSFNFALSLLAVVIGIAVAAPQAGQQAAPQATTPAGPPAATNFPINSLKRFPHHVAIETVPASGNDSAVCGGTILAEQWIITSARCVVNATRLKLHFQRLDLNDTTGSYSAIVNKDAVYSYPSIYDDVALVKIPFKLVFSSILTNLKLNAEEASSLKNKLVVLPSFVVPTNSNSSRLTYAMLNIAANSVCKEKNSDFDEYGQLCTSAWGTRAAAVCPANVGSGLIVDWPSSPKLVGIYSSSTNCTLGNPTYYTDVSKYTAWIESVME